ncbi:hypothetical protein N1495_04475 [Streptococcus didelphis]|nr:hypothetical protein [Streptococcus didelphis]WMB30081.1 hypothetical protein N1495_04475 [Streptococcus didelphis]
MLKKEKYITKFLLLSLLLPSLQTISVFAEEIEASVSSSPVVETTPTIDNKNFDLAKPSENTPNMGSDLDSSSDKGSIDSPKPPQTNNDQSAGGTSTKPDQDNKETPSPTPQVGHLKKRILLRQIAVTSRYRLLMLSLSQLQVSLRLVQQVFLLFQACLQ